MGSVKDWRPPRKPHRAGKITRVGGAQAEQAREDLRLIKITEESARTLFDARIPFVIVPRNVNSFHFFKGWHLAMEVEPERYKDEGWTFDEFLNNWNWYNENPETGKAAFFVGQELIQEMLWRK